MTRPAAPRFRLSLNGPSLVGSVVQHRVSGERGTVLSVERDAEYVWTVGVGASVQTWQGPDALLLDVPLTCAAAEVVISGVEGSGTSHDLTQP